MFDDLKQAIKDVLNTANAITIEQAQALDNLRAEYNISFVEPEDEQLEIIR